MMPPDLQSCLEHGNADFYRPCKLRGKKAVKNFVAGLGSDAHRWLLALYVDGNLDLLAVDKIAQGDISSCPIPFGRILTRGEGLKAEAFILVHNNPSGDPTPSREQIQATRRLAEVSHECGLPLLDHFIIVGDQLQTVSSGL